MSKSITKQASHRFSARVTLAAVGMKLRQLNLLGSISQRVNIEQKVVKYTPVEKLYDAFIAILAGAHGLVEINKRLRSEHGLQAAFGRQSCAEQSVVQDTLDASSTTNVEQMHQAMDEIYRQRSCGFRHDYAHSWQLLDVDIDRHALWQEGSFGQQGVLC